MKKIIAALLAMLMLLSCVGLISCSKKTHDADNGDGTDTLTVDTNGDEGEGDDLSAVLNVPEGLNLGGDFNILAYNTYPEEYCEEIDKDTDAVDRSLYQRDHYVNDYLGVTIKYIPLDGDYNHRVEFSNHVLNAVLANERAFDLVAAYSMVPPNLAVQGVLTDMSSLEYTDFEKAWYSDFMTDSCTINGKTYFMSGDISINMLYRMQGIAFSASKAAENGIYEDDLYQMVYDGTWTIENWLNMCLGMASETSGDGVWDENDFYPIHIADNTWVDSFYFSTGLNLIEKNASGQLVASTDPTEDKALNIHSMLMDAQNTHKTVFRRQNAKGIMRGECIFSVCTIEYFRAYFNESKEQFRVLPFPKYEEGTDTPYQTTLGFGHYQYCIPIDITDPSRSAAVFQTLGYASYTYVTPVVFEETMKLKYSSNVDVANMFDYMRNGRTIDVASLFCDTFDANDVSAPHGMFRVAIVQSIPNWTSNYKSQYEAGIITITNLLNTFYAK